MSSCIDDFLKNGLAKRIFTQNDVIFLSTSCGTRFGLIPKKLLPLLESFPEVFAVYSRGKNEDIIIKGDDFESRSAAALVFSTKLKENFSSIAEKCNLSKLKIGWRNEKFGVYPFGSDPRFPETALFTIERALCKVLGIESYGVHCNVFKQEKGGEIKLWIGKRAMNKSTFPGKLDTAIGGGMIYGLTVEENLIKEAEEEASVSPDATKTAQFVKLARYCWHTEFYIKREAIFIFDLDLSTFPDPHPNDGEQLGFQAESLNSQVFQNAQDWKPNSLAVSIDFARRNGAAVQSEVVEELLSDECNIFQ